MRIHGDLKSGNCLKVKYCADRLGLAYSWVDVDIMKGESRTPEFLAKSAMGQVPIVELADDRVIAQSNAILRYLARGTALLPDDAYTQAKIDELLCWEQYNHEPYIAVCRFHMVYQNKAREEREPMRVARGEAALDFMNAHLAGRRFLVGEALSIADIALVAYTRLAHEGGFDLAAHGDLRAWIARCENELNLAPARAA